MYNYEKEMQNDICEYLGENYTGEELAERLKDRDEFEQELNDTLWTEDGVTGNSSGSYTFNRCKAKCYVCDNFATLRCALNEFCVDPAEIGERFLSEDWEWFDVTIRCFLLSSCIAEVLEDLA